MATLFGLPELAVCGFLVAATVAGGRFRRTETVDDHHRDNHNRHEVHRAGNPNIVITTHIGGPNSVIEFHVQAPGDPYVNAPMGADGAVFCGVPPPPF